MAEFTGKIDLGYQNTNVHEATHFEIWGMVPPKYFNTYVVTICFMEGDCDGYAYQEVVIKDEKTLKEFVDFCFRCAVAYPHGKGGHDGYEHIKGYTKFVSGSYIEYWPYADGEYPYFFDWFKVEYYGPTGVPCTVKVITEVINDKETGGVSS